MLFARAPFDDPLATTDKARRDATMQQILRGEWNVPASVPVAPECLDLLRGILSPDPNTRFTLAQIMSHPWFSVSAVAEGRGRGRAAARRGVGMAGQLPGGQSCTCNVQLLSPALLPAPASCVLLPTPTPAMRRHAAAGAVQVGLPPAALTMNTVLVRQQTAQPPPYEQSVEDVNTVLEEATQRPGHGQGGGLGGSEITDSGFMTMVRVGGRRRWEGGGGREAV